MRIRQKKDTLEEKGKMMKFLWAPWRMDYILREKEEGCFFCKTPLEHRDRENLILYRGKSGFVVMNKFPYSNGHLLIVPYRHCITIEDLRGGEMKELFNLVKAGSRALREALHPHGLNIGVNVGKAGGAGEDHIHIHVVPRWVGDTNFMPVLGETKVIPQYLDETYRKLKAAFRGLFEKKMKRKG